MTDSKLLDSSVWLEYFHNKKFSEIVESDDALFVSTLSLFEIKKKLLLEKQSFDNIMISLNFIRNRSIIIFLDEKIAELAANISLQYKLGAVDALIYTTALSHKVELITLDNDFRNLPNAKVLEK